MATKTDPTNNLTFAEAFRTSRAAGDKTFQWNGKDYTTDVATSPNRANKVGQAIALPRDEERGRTRGRSDSGVQRYSNEGRSGRSLYQESMPQDAEAGMTRGRSDSGIQDYSNEGRTAYKRGGSVKGYKAGGRVTGYKGYGIAKKV